MIVFMQLIDWYIWHYDAWTAAVEVYSGCGLRVFMVANAFVIHCFSIPLNVLLLILGPSGQHFRLRKKYFFGPQVVRPQWLKMMQYEVGMKKRWKKVWEKFAGSEKVPTFAIPLRNKGTSLRQTSWADGVWKGSPEGLKYRKSSLKRLKKVQGSKYQNTKNESVNFLKELEVPDWTWRIRNIQRRVWSWLRMNASGRLNTCKSRGSVEQQCSDGDRRKGA